jgi:hypothetical protein
MTRTYIRKTKPHYTADDLEKSLGLIRDRKMTVNEAAKQYHIPLATLYARLLGFRGGSKAGVKTILSREEEQFLIHVIHKFQEWQQPLTQSDLISMARTFMIELKKKNINNDSSLREWFYSFRQRWHNDIKLVKTYQLERARSSSCTQLVVGKNKLLLFNIMMLFFRSMV